MLKIYGNQKSFPLKKVTSQSCVVDLLWPSHWLHLGKRANYQRLLQCVQSKMWKGVWNEIWCHDVITLNSWKLAVQVFWRDILKLDLLKSFSCDSSKDNWFFLWTFLFLSQVVDLDLMQAMKATIRDRSRRKVLVTSSSNRYSRLSIQFGRKFSQVLAMKK